MDLVLASQKSDKIVINVEEGGYYTWSSSNFPLLSQQKLAAGVLVLQPLGFATPHYADSSKIGYVTQGSCTVGMISPNSTTEDVIELQKGDAIPVHLGAVSWWYNSGDTELSIIFLGKSGDYAPGEFAYFFLTGALSLLSAFSNECIKNALKMTKIEPEKFINNNTPFIVKVEKGTNLPEPNNNIKHKLVYNLGTDKISEMTSKNFNLLENYGLSANLVILEGGSLFGPMFTADSSDQLSYVVKGSGRVQIVGVNKIVVLDAKVQQGQLFFVPKFFPFAVEADEGGIEFFSVITSSEQVFGKLAGENSVWAALSPSIV